MNLYLVEIESPTRHRWNKVVAVHATDDRQMVELIEAKYKGKMVPVHVSKLKEAQVIVNLPSGGLPTHIKKLKEKS